MSRTFSIFAAAGLLGLLASGPVAIAADQSSGSTTGPPAGTPVKPSTAMSNRDNGSGSPGKQAVQGDLAVGAPGVKAKPNTEAGPSAKTATSQSTMR